MIRSAGIGSLFVWLTCLTAGAAELPDSPPPAIPHWIETSSANLVPVGRNVEIRDAIQSARLKVAADFCEIAVEINGVLPTVIEPFSETLDLDVTAWMKRGGNQLTIRPSHAEGPATVALELTISTSSGRQSVVTDESWQVSGQGAQVRSLGQVTPELWGIGRRSAAIDAFDNYEAWRQASGGER